eukprot:2977261-Rhodomonas_salina.1
MAGGLSPPRWLITGPRVGLSAEGGGSQPGAMGRNKRFQAVSPTLETRATTARLQSLLLSQWLPVSLPLPVSLLLYLPHSESLSFVPASASVSVAATVTVSASVFVSVSGTVFVTVSVK